MPEEGCFDCGEKGHFIAVCPLVVCFYCIEKGHRAPKCPWNPIGKAATTIMDKEVKLGGFNLWLEANLVVT